MSLAVKPREAWYVPFAEATTAEYAAIVKPLFENEAIAKIGQNVKFDLMVLRRIGIELRGRKYDTMILHYLLDPESRHNMNALAERYLDYKPIEIETLIGKGSKQLTMDLVGVERVKEYAAEDADITLQLKHVLYPMVERIGLHDLYFDIEEPMIDVLAEIEEAGVRIDTAALAEYAVELNRKLGMLENAIRDEAGEPSLNINSTRQLGEVLFGKMRIAEKPKMTKTKQFCTDEEYLQSFAHKHRIVDLVLEYRGVKKLLSTYVEALPQLVNRRTGRIHTSFNQAVTATGRLSSTNPNLQNIPVRDEMGRRIREAFIPSDDDHVLLSADYSQVELRLMAHLSGDESLIAAFAHGEDVHAATAAKLFGKPIAEVTAEERRRAKTANFGIIYGISAFGLSQRLEIPRKEAKELIDGYFASLSEGAGVYGARGRRGPPRRLCGHDLRPPPLPQRHRVAQCRGARSGRTQRCQCAHSGLGGRHHEDRHDRRLAPLRGRRDPLAGDPAGARRTGGRHAARGSRSASRGSSPRAWRPRPRSRCACWPTAASEPTGSRRIEGAGFFVLLRPRPTGSPFRTLCRGISDDGCASAAARPMGVSAAVGRSIKKSRSFRYSSDRRRADPARYFSLRTPLNGVPSCFTSMNFPVAASLLTYRPVLGFNTWLRSFTAPLRCPSP